MRRIPDPLETSRRLVAWVGLYAPHLHDYRSGGLSGVAKPLPL
jgi:hypothetical protein